MDTITENLIDLSSDDNDLIQDTTNLLLIDAEAAPSHGTSCQPHACHFIAPMNLNDSSENNPFDMVQKLATEPGDPFELVEHQARIFPQKSMQVKEGDLLCFNSGTDSGFETPPQNEPTLSSATSKDKNKSVEQRKRLLKLSLTKSSCQTPTGRNCSPLNMLVDESPLKWVDDDLMSETPPEYASPSLDNDFEKDLRELQIPILKELPSIDLETEIKEEKKRTKEINETPTSCNNLSNLEILKAKLHAKRLEKQEQNSIKGIIKNLRSLICDSDLPDVEKKQRASSLLETLSCCVEDTENKNKQAILKIETPPTPIKREGTFDMDLIAEPANTEKALPEIMISSTATYDGDNDKHDLDLPEVALPQLEQSNYQQDITGIGTGFDLNELVEQLSKLLGQQKLSNSANDSTESQHAANPTVIVVMNTSNVNNLEDSNNISQVNRATQAFRRRSQSLSLIDKVRIVQLPLTETHAQMSDENEDQYSSPPIPEHMLSTRQNETDMDSQFKTPSRIFRRNSFSSGTPVTHNSIMGRRVGPELLQKTRRLTQHIEKRQIGNMLRTMSSTMRPETRSRTKAESIVKTNGPMKATIPLKKIAPSFKVKERLDASMNFLHRPEQISCTSTPMPAIRQINATPQISPMKLNKSRVSQLPVTPNTKSTAAHNSSAVNLNRRAISELRTKSPIKSRIGVMGGISKPVVSGRSITTRSSASSTNQVGQRNLNRLAVPSGMKTVLGTNKENKRP